MDSGKYGKRSGWPGETPARAIIVNFPAIYFGRSVLPITPLVDVRSPGPGGHRRRSSRIGCRPSGDIRIAAGFRRAANQRSPLMSRFVSKRSRFSAEASINRGI